MNRYASNKIHSKSMRWATDILRPLGVRMKAEKPDTKYSKKTTKIYIYINLYSS
jgi:hypothetical protein